MGYAVGTQCFRHPEEAAQAYCASVSGMTSAGYMRCYSAEWQETNVWFNYTTIAPDGSESAQGATAYLAPCTPMDLEEWSPAIAAWFLALVVILCARSIYTKVFNRESY